MPLSGQKKSLINGLFIKALLLLLVFGLMPLLLVTSSRQPDLHPCTPVSPDKDDHLKHVYVVFINGLGCKYTGSHSGKVGFRNIRLALEDVGYSYNDDRFLQYSYAGGKMVDGRWRPERFTSRDTAQPLFISVKRLALLLEQFSASVPEAEFVLVGHSLGGRVAMDFLCTATPPQREKIRGVLTMNSPLLGASRKIPAPVMHALDYMDSIWAGPAAKQLLYEMNFRQELFYLRRDTIQGLQKDGLRVATFSTRQDLFVDPLTGCLTDKNGAPCTDGYIIDQAGFYPRDPLGHMRILESREVAGYICSLY